MAPTGATSSSDSGGGLGQEAVIGLAVGVPSLLIAIGAFILQYKYRHGDLQRLHGVVDRLNPCSVRYASHEQYGGYQEGVIRGEAAVLPPVSKTSVQRFSNANISLFTLRHQPGARLPLRAQSKYCLHPNLM